LWYFLYKDEYAILKPLKKEDEWEKREQDGRAEANLDVIYVYMHVCMKMSQISPYITITY
jgi:hypothetical protein